MRAVIVGGGDKPSKELLNKYRDDTAVIIAADSGCDVLSEYNIAPDYLLGDFDSIDEQVLKSIKDRMDVTTLPREKDYTDTHVAYLKAVEMGADEVVLLGCTGKRIDHFMANLSVLYKGLKDGVKVVMADEYNEIFMADAPLVLYGKSGQVFSVFSYGEAVEGLTFNGAKYHLEGYDLSLTDNLTVSNEFASDKVEIKFHKGCLLIILNRK